MSEANTLDEYGVTELSESGLGLLLIMSLSQGYNKSYIEGWMSLIGCRG